MIWRRRNRDEYLDEGYANRPVRQRREGPLLWVHVSLLAVAGGLFIGAVWAVSGQTMAGQVLKSLATPIGVLWLLLFGQMYFSLLFRQPWPAILGIVAWTLLTVAGNQAVKRAMIRSLESPYLALDALEMEPFDTILVLGGGTNVTSEGVPQLSMAGDRVMLAARMFHAKKTAQIVVSGQQFSRSSPKDLDPKDEARRILIEVGVPESQIVTLDGLNTSEEMANFKTWLATQTNPGPDSADQSVRHSNLDAQPENQPDSSVQTEDRPKRIGVITSAWHLPRSMKLARKNNLDLQPIPANFLTGIYSPDPSLIVPSAENLHWTGTMLLEHLAPWIGR